MKATVTWRRSASSCGNQAVPAVRADGGRARSWRRCDPRHATVDLPFCMVMDHRGHAARGNLAGPERRRRWRGSRTCFAWRGVRGATAHGSTRTSCTQRSVVAAAGGCAGSPRSPTPTCPASAFRPSARGPAARASRPNSTRLAGTWRIVLTHRGGPPATVHAWVEREQAGQARLVSPPAGRRRTWARFTLGSLCCGRHTIIVGAARRTALGGGVFAPWPHSGAGPRPWGRAPIDWAVWQDARRPHLCAVGVAAAAAGGLAANDAVVMDGTSQAAPQVAGAAALIMQDAAARGRRLSAAEIRAALIEGARGRAVCDRFGLDPAAAERAGAGVLDPLATVAAACRL